MREVCALFSGQLAPWDLHTFDEVVGAIVAICAKQKIVINVSHKPTEGFERDCFSVFLSIH